MKLKSILLIPFSLLLFVGCSSKINCSDDNVTDTVIDVVFEDDISTFRSYQGDEKADAARDKRVYTLKNIRLLERNDDSGAVGCAASYDVYYKEEDKELGPFHIQYVASPTEDGSVYVQVFNQ